MKQLKRNTHLSVSVLDSRDVTLPESTLNEPKHQRTFTDSSGPEDNHTVVVTLLRHFGKTFSSVVFALVPRLYDDISGKSVPIRTHVGSLQNVALAPLIFCAKLEYFIIFYNRID